MLYFKLDSGNIISGDDVSRVAEIAYGLKIDRTDEEAVRSIAVRMVGINYEIVDESDAIVEHLLEEGRKMKAIQVYYTSHNCSIGEARIAVESMIKKLNAETDSDDDQTAHDTCENVYDTSVIRDEVIAYNNEEV